MPREKVKVVEVRAVASDAEFAKNEGKFFNVTSDMQVFDEDVDVYAIQTDEDVAAGAPRRKLLAKFRKNVFKPDQVQVGWDAFRLLAIPSRNRGAAAGPIDLKGVYWSRRKPVETTGWSTRYMQNGKPSKMRVNNVVASGVIGNYEKTPFLGQPCRMTGYTRRGLKQYLHGIPFLEAIDRKFKELVPEAHRKQLAAVSQKPMYQISDTAFSTLTVNMNFRTAMHKDAGDYGEGFGNLTVLEWGKYHGGETIFPDSTRPSTYGQAISWRWMCMSGIRMRRSWRPRRMQNTTSLCPIFAPVMQPRVSSVVRSASSASVLCAISVRNSRIVWRRIHMTITRRLISM
jgi:hypothetical protein